jgi:hypothetical protein
MGFLDGLSNIFRGIGHLFGGDNGDDQKKKQQQQAQQSSPQAPRQGAPIPLDTQNDNPTIDLTQPLAKANANPGTQLIQSGNTPAPQTLAKAPLTPHQQASKAFVDSQGGPNPNYVSHKPNFLDEAGEFAKGFGHDAVNLVPKIIDGVTGGTQHLADVINYPIQTKQYSDLAKKGEISNDTALQLMDEARQKAGFGINDSGGTLLRKTASAVAGPTAAVLTAGAAPEVLGGLEALSPAARLLKGGITGSKIGAGFGGIQALGEDKLTPLTAAKDVGVGAGTGFGVGALAPEVLRMGSDLVKNVGGRLLPSTTPEIAPGIKSANPDQALHAAQQLEKANPAAPTNLDTPAYQRQGQPEPVIQSNLDIPTFQRNNANELVKSAQAKVDNLDAAMGNIGPANQASRAADQAELAAAMQRSPEEGANVLRQQLLKKAAGVQDPEAARAGIQPVRDKAAAELTDAQNIQQAHQALNPTEANPAKVSGTIVDPKTGGEITLPNGYKAETISSGDQFIIHPDGSSEPLKAYLGRTKAGAPDPTVPAIEAPQPIAPEAVPAQATVLPDVSPTRPVTPAEEAATHNIVHPTAPVEAVAPTIQPPVELPQAPAPAPAENSIPNPEARVAENAPRIRDAAIKQNKDAFKALSKDGQTHEVLSNPEMTAAGKAVADTLSDEQILTRYSQPVKFQDAAQMSVAKAERDRLSVIYRDAATPEAKAAAQTALDNLVEASAEVTSRGARSLNYAQEMLDGMPKEAKVSYYIQRIDKLNIAKNGDAYETIASDPARRLVVEAELDKLFSKEDKIKGLIADQSAILDKGTTQEGRANVSTEDLKAASSVLQGLEHQRQSNAADMVKYYDSLVPGGRSLADKATDWQRTAMLSSPTGRIHALGSTGLNVVDEAAKQGASGLLGKVYNKFVAPEKAVNDTGMHPLTVAKGAIEGAKKSIDTALGKATVENPEKAFAANAPGSDTMSGMNKMTGGKFKRVVNAAVELHSNMTQGVAQSELERSARTEGLREGLSGEDLKKYTISRTAQPSPTVHAAASEVHATLNNLNNNPLTNILQGVSKAIADKGGPVGKVAANQILPFPRFLAGNFWNTVTDRNVVAAAAKLTAQAGKAALGKGDAQEFINALSKTGIEGAKAYGLGWVLTENKVLTNQDANGKNYDGVYLHIGDRYIPAGALGFLAPSLILGNAAHQGFNDPNNKGNVTAKIAETASKGLGNMFRAEGGQSITGSTDSIAGPTSQAFTSSGTDDPSKLAKVGANIIGQNIPSFTSDINAAINQFGGDPTHEAAETTVKELNPDTGKQKTNSLKSAQASIENKIPILSQGLPRQTGVAAADLLDKVLKSNQDTPTTLQKKGDAKTTADLVKENKAAGVPMYNAPAGFYKNGDSFDQAVKSLSETGKFDQAIKGLQGKLDALKKGADYVPSEGEKVNDQIKNLQVVRDGKFTNDELGLYKTGGDKTVSLSEWRKMGDPESDSYDQATYDRLYQLDSAMAAAGISRNASDNSKNFYTAKEAGKGHKGGAGGSGYTAGGGISSLTPLTKINFGSLAPQKIAATSAAPIQPVKAGDLVKKRSISVSKVA